jgi:PAS domain S-box-containing protein
MDEQTQSFLELSAMDDLVELVDDKRAAWLWSSDGARILWANSAGAAFFGAHSVSDLHRLPSLERSPARPHIARIAEAGPTDKFSIDRLRFYRGLRVMLLTCQCKRLELAGGTAAALIVCGDKGLAATKNPFTAFARLLGSETSMVFVTEGGASSEIIGDFAGTPEDLDLPADQNVLYGAIELDGALHDGAVLKISERQKLIVLDNAALADNDTGDTEDLRDDTEGVAAAEAEAAAPNVDDTAASDTGPMTDRVEDGGETDSEAASGDTGAPAPEKGEETGEETGVASEEEAVPVDTETEAAESPGLAAVAETTPAGAPPMETAPQDTQSAAPEDGFVFRPRRRPVRFAWKMDIDQRFTFLSDEFADVLGPETTDIVGQTWEEVARKFALDPRGQIARALDRRDTWSGKTVDWPVSGADLRVPVDMAALPAFDRNRKFEGYRGFGVCRSADATQAPAIVPLVAAPAATAPEDADRDTDGTSAAAPAGTVTEPGAEPEEAAGRPATEVGASETPAAVRLDDLKPAAPESLSGRTFLGASAAALVGSLARFTGKAAPAAPDAAGSPDVIDASLRSESAAPRNEPPAASEAGPDETNSDDLTGSEADDDARDLPGAALDSKLEALQSGRAVSTGPAEDGEPREATADAAEDAAKDETVGEDDSHGRDAAEAGPAAQVSGTAEPETDIPVEAAGEEDRAQEAAEDTGEAEAPTGIAGPAPLKPAEIESAVKSLAKTYKTAENRHRDLFESAPDGTEADGAAETGVPAEDGGAIGEAAEEEALQPETQAGAEHDGHPGETGGEDGLADATSGEAVQALEDARFDIVDEESRAVEATAAQLGDAAGEAPGPVGAQTAGPPEETADDERGFFAETAAFEDEDQAREAASAEDAAPDAPRTGEVIPLATARPRVVPVDTSGLSRPERQAFRKIAEALGARLEGDLEDFDAPDPEQEQEDDLPPDVPEAGPIDPTLLDRLPIGIAIVHDREVLYANKALLAMLGYGSVATLSQAGGLEALFIDDTEELPDAAGMDGEVDEALKLRLADGGVLNVDAHMHSVPWNGSRGLMISITERKAKPAQPGEGASPNFFAEVRGELESARNQIAEMDTILETATDGVLVLDRNGTILKVNGSAEALFSANRADMIGAPFTQFLAPESHRAAADYLDGLSRNGVASILNDGREVLGQVPAGGLIPLFMTMGRIGGGREDAKYCAVLRDITQWKTAEEELTQAKRQAENASSQKSDFLAKISHEIRTPLNAIIGFSEVMMEERFGPIGNDRYKDYLKDIRTSGSHIMSLVNDLLDLSKIEAGKLDLNFSAVSTNDVINECVALMQPQANRERVIIRASLPDSVPDVVADPRSLRQIVLNLLSNAIKYNRSGGQVILSTALESNGEVALRVRDTGTGMTAKQLAAALEPFRQLHTASRGGGTGLGLPLTKALVEANRASFHIDSTPDQGTLVEVVFPTQRVLSE